MMMAILSGHDALWMMEKWAQTKVPLPSMPLPFWQI